MRDVAGDRQSERKSECKKPPRQKGVKFLTDKVQSTRRGKLKIKAAKREANK
jgi:hypothetical protein